MGYCRLGLLGRQPRLLFLFRFLDHGSGLACYVRTKTRAAQPTPALSRRYLICPSVHPKRIEPSTCWLSYHSIARTRTATNVNPGNTLQLRERLHVRYIVCIRLHTEPQCVCVCGGGGWTQVEHV
jgi:hypothetical protein